MRDELDRAIALRQEKRADEAHEILSELIAQAPKDPDLNYQMAWTCDLLGKESEAVGYYERALANGLVNDRLGAMLGLGSTYRCLGQYERSLAMFDEAIEAFPDERSLKVFRAMTLYNLGRADEAVGELLLALVETTRDESILSYQGALRFYADKLDQTWSD